MSKVIAERAAIESAAIPFDADVFTLPGYCACCEARRTFQVSGMYASQRLPDGRLIPNWREHLNCLTCGLTSRLRASLQILRETYRPAESARIYMTERKTRTYEWMAKRYRNLQGSEYFLGSYRSGDQVDGIQHEDVQHLSFADNSFDFILTFEVLEHVPDPQQAFSELCRCLRPNGVLMVSVPFSWIHEEHLIRAVMHDDGEIEHILEPEIHGNPVDPEGGSLCFRYFGWRILDDLRDAGFVDAEVLNYWSRDLKYFGDPQFIMTARKP
jgi:SAM-dependent methyltransferase